MTEANEQPSDDLPEEARRRWAELEAVCDGARTASILIYGNVDPDALSSAWALKRILRKLRITALVGFTGEVGRLQNEAMITLLGIPAAPWDEDAVRRVDRVALVDAQPGFFPEEEEELPPFDIVIDHHPRKEESAGADVAFEDIRPECLATASMMVEYLRAGDVPVGSHLATALSYGLETDRQGLQREPSEVDRQAEAFLETRMDGDLLRRIKSSQYTLGELDYFSIALVKRRYADGVMYAHLGPVPFSDVCAQVADFLIRVREVKMVIVSGVSDRTVVVVFRYTGDRKHTGRIAHDAFGEVGSAGGHRTMGRAEIKEEDLPEAVRLTSNEAVERFVLGALTRVDPSFDPLLSGLPSSDVRE